MKLVTIKCPNCNARLEVSKSITTLHCEHCGYDCEIEDIKDYIVDAKIKEKEIEKEEKIAKMKYDLEKNKQEHEQEMEKTKFNVICKVVGIVLIVLILLFAIFELIVFTQKMSFNNTTKEVRELIEKKEYSEAESKTKNMREKFIDGSYPEIDKYDLLDEIRDAKEKDSNYTKLPRGYKEYKGMNYKEIKSEFKELGFTNVKAIELKESSGLFKKKHSIKYITIDGEEHFTSSNLFDKHSKVILYYYYK